MLDPLHLRTLTTVLQTGSFAVAARQLGYTPSAVSQQIAALERAVRLPVFERGARSVRPTPAAALLAVRGQEVLAALGVLQDDLRAFAEGSSGRGPLGSFPTASRYLLPGALAASHPAVEVVLDEGEPDELAPRVRGGDLDIALVHRYTRVPGRRPRALSVTPLLREDPVLLLPAGRPLAGRGRCRSTSLRTPRGSPPATAPTAPRPCSGCVPMRVRAPGVLPQQRLRRRPWLRPIRPRRRAGTGVRARSGSRCGRRVARGMRRTGTSAC
jgi:DNA-binding transcriptional LysR family regulator